MSTFSKDKSSINSVEKSSHRILMIIGIILVIVTSPIIFSIPAELNQGNQAIWFTLVFPLTGFGILWGGWLIRKKYTFFGPTPLQLSPAIGQLGGQIGGQINLNQPWGSRKITVRLSCIHTYTTGSGDNSSSHNDILWQRETQAYIQNNTNTLIFFFDAPADKPLSGKKTHKGIIKWEVMVEGLVSYNTFKRHWVIPVTLGTLQSDIKIPQSHTKSVQKAQIQAAESSVDRQINTQTTAQGLNIISEPGRNKSMSRFACLLGFIFTAAGCFLFYFALQGELMLWLMAPMFFSIGSGIWAYGIFLAGRKLECKMIDGRVYIRRSLFGKSLYSREGPLTSADQLELKTTMSSQQGSVKTEYMAIYAQVRCADGIRKIKLVEGIEGLAAGEAMHRKLRFAIEPK